MVKEITITCMSEFFEFLKSIQYFEESIERHWCNYYFRGIKDVNYSLATSLHRNAKGYEEKPEKRILIHFEKFAQFYKPAVTNSVWETLVFAQHYGAPTRLLDWTKSPLTALHFATEHIDTRAKIGDACVWAINNHQLNDLLPSKYRQNMAANFSTVCTMNELRSSCTSLQEYEEDMDGQGFLIFEPDSIDERIVAQSSLFAIIPRKLDPLDDYLRETREDTLTAYKLIFPKESLHKIRDDLDMLGISERLLYPGLEGIAKMLKRLYYHRPNDAASSENCF